MFYYVCARDFGWTPLETDEQPAGLVDYMIAIAAIQKEVENAQREPPSGQGFGH